MNVILNNLKIENIILKNKKNKIKIYYNINGIILLGIPISITILSSVKIDNFVLIKVDKKSNEILKNIQDHLIQYYPQMIPFINSGTIKMKYINIINNKINISISQVKLSSKRAQIFSF